MDRRDFLKQVAAYSAGLAAAAPFFDVALARAADSVIAGGSTVAVAREDYARITADVVAKLGGMGQFVKKGDKVVIKPNIGWDRSPEQGANTHPEVVLSLVKLALDAGAGKVQVFDRSCNDRRRCYVNSGIQAAVESIGDPRATCPFAEDKDFVSVKLASGKAMTEWPIHKDALEADCFINVPVAKHHGLTKLTLGMKNMMGICGGNRGKIHQEIAQKLADLHTLVKPRLTVIDATRILLRGGPQGGKPDDVKIIDTVLASTDPVAIDAYATTLFGLKPADIAPTVAAFRMGLGQMDLDKIKVVEA